MSTTPYLPLSPQQRRYGWYNSNPLSPSRKLRALRAQAGVEIPSRYDLWKFMGPIRDQQQEGSCTGHAGAAHRELLYNAQYAYEKDKSIPQGQINLSPSFVYKCNLIADGDLGQDAGSSIHQTIITLNRNGACLETDEPYLDTDYSTAPSPVQYEGALTYKGGSYHFLPDLDAMKHCIASGYSFIFGITVYDSFEGEWKKPGFMPMPDVKKEEVRGGHAQHVLAYDDNMKFADGNVGGLGVQNSWGKSWGLSVAWGRSDNGCYWMPYAFINAGLTDDAWMIHLGHAWRPANAT